MLLFKYLGKSAVLEDIVCCSIGSREQVQCEHLLGAWIVIYKKGETSEKTADESVKSVVFPSEAPEQAYYKLCNECEGRQEDWETELVHKGDLAKFAST